MTDTRPGNSDLTPQHAATRPVVDLFTDGACSGNPGPGGWAFILRHPSTTRELESSGGDPDTTNNRMELLAVIRGLESLKRPCRVRVHTDSVYVGQGMTKWMPNWKRNNWRRRGREGEHEIKNLDLWKQLDALLEIHEVEYHSVRGHSGHPENERCDELAVMASLQQQG